MLFSRHLESLKPRHLHTSFWTKQVFVSDCHCCIKTCWLFVWFGGLQKARFNGEQQRFFLNNWTETSGKENARYQNESHKKILPKILDIIVICNWNIPSGPSQVNWPFLFLFTFFEWLSPSIGIAKPPFLIFILLSLTTVVVFLSWRTPTNFGSYGCLWKPQYSGSEKSLAQDGPEAPWIKTFSNAHFKIYEHERSLDLKIKSKCKYSCKQQLRGQAQQNEKWKPFQSLTWNPQFFAGMVWRWSEPNLVKIRTTV